MSEPVKPAYGGPCVSSIVPALLARSGGAWMPEPVHGARTVVLLVLDGLGWDSASQMPELGELSGGPITTVLPSTTPTVLTSITTGRAPSEHGIVGFRMRAGPDLLDVLWWSGAGGPSEYDPATFQPLPPFGGSSVPVVSKAEFSRGAFTAAHLRGARYLGWRTPSTLVEHVRILARAGEPLVYAYYDGIDVLAHSKGISSSFFQAELRFTGRLVADLLAVLPPDAALLVTADHGQVPLEESSWIDLADLAPLIETYSGDGRMRYLHARDGAAAELLHECASRYAAVAWVMSREELLERGWLGPPPSPAVAQRVGDVVLAARAQVAFADPALPLERSMRSGHGSATEAEMLVPLLAARGRA